MNIDGLEFDASHAPKKQGTFKILIYLDSAFYNLFRGIYLPGLTENNAHKKYFPEGTPKGYQ